MSDSQITIFYSWQSDLPGNETRSIIQDGIKDAVRLLRDTVNIEADRDTKGEYGSPDIAQTIFSKIDECDIFIADVSAVCKYEVVEEDGSVKTKYMPNPNVMLELGYATHVVGWENVICVLNADYGAPEDMPFDIASRRLTLFSLKNGASKGEAKRFIRGVIQETVENILENGKRVKSGFSNLRLGCIVDKMISTEMQPIELSKAKVFSTYKERTLLECSVLLREIQSIQINEPSEELKAVANSNITCGEEVEKESFVTKDGVVLTPVKQSIALDLFKKRKVTFTPESIESTIEHCKRYLDVDISTDSEFFYIGNLKEKPEFGITQSYSFDGTAEEINKYEKIIELDCKLGLLSMMDWYISTFDGMLFIPLAIENVSTVFDEDIDVHLQIDNNSAEVIVPSKDLINPDMKGLEGYIVEEELIKKLLLMEETSTITYDTDITYSIADTQAAIRAQISAAGINGNPKYNEEDYEREISKYIAKAVDEGNTEFSFTINSLRAKERKWLGPALLIRPLADSVEMTYTIKSKNSDGSLSGNLRYRK